MTPSLLRCLWQIIEESPSQRLLELDEHALVDWLLAQVNKNRLLQHAEQDAIATYLHSHQLLIREMAATQAHTHCPLQA